MDASCHDMTAAQSNIRLSVRVTHGDVPQCVLKLTDGHMHANSHSQADVSMRRTASIVVVDVVDLMVWS